MSNKRVLVGFGAFSVFVAAGWMEPAFATQGLPCSGVWKANQELSHRTRGAVGPYQFFESWGDNGWMRMNTGSVDKPVNGGEWHFELFNNKPYQVFGGDPSLQHSRHITDNIIETTRVRNHKESDYSLVVFAKDCKRVTYYNPEGDDAHGAGPHYYNDIQVFDAIEAPDSAAATVSADFFGGWMLNRQASKLTLGPRDSETVVIVPWGKAGWIWSQLSGGRYQPEDLMHKVERVECGGPSGPCNTPPPSSLTLYWATLDGRTFPAYGSEPKQVQTKRFSDRMLDVTFIKSAQGAAQMDNETVVLAPDGKRMTVTTKNGGGDDVRVYDRIEADNWPTVAP